MRTWWKGGTKGGREGGREEGREGEKEDLPSLLLHLLDDANLTKILGDLRFRRSRVQAGNEDGAVDTQLVHLAREGGREGGRVNKECFRNFCFSRVGVEPGNEGSTVDAQLVHLGKKMREGGRKGGREGGEK